MTTDRTSAPLSAEATLAAFLKAASDPLRLLVLRLLKQDSFAVLELCQLLAVKQSALSHHLKVLAQAELVVTRREGNTIFYRRYQKPDCACKQLRQALFDEVDQLALDAAVLARLTQVRRERALSSVQFFGEMAQAFRQQQEQIADYELYGSAVAAMLDQLALDSRALALEVGPGNGQFLLELAARFERVVGIDNSQSMLAQARETVRLKDNIELQHGDFNEALGFTPNCVVMNMVLHHTSSPQEVVAAAGRMLQVGGHLVICDLGHHQQAWVRESCGDIWFGFEPDELTGWFAQAGLTCEHSQYLALRNGFQIQIHAARKYR